MEKQDKCKVCKDEINKYQASHFKKGYTFHEDCYQAWETCKRRGWCEKFDIFEKGEGW